MKSTVCNALLLSVLGFVLGGCMIAKRPAPVVERAPEKPTSAQQAEGAAQGRNTYVVKRGDTLYSIARAHVQDHRDVARWNKLADPSAIEVGQVLFVRDPALAQAPAATVVAPPLAQENVVTTPYQTAPVVEGREVGIQTPPPVPGSVAEGVGDSSVVSGPLAVKVPYSDAALAKMRETTPDVSTQSAPVAVAVPGGKLTPPLSASEETDGIAWSWPAKGTIVANFNENGGPKGLHIAGEMGQAVHASADGRVVYTGSGLRGYGNIVIIKHNNTYLSAYAHNRKVLVKQGDSVTKGQKIAEMGNTDASRVMLHFEIRRMGKPVDPVKFLPQS